MVGQNEDIVVSTQYLNVIQGISLGFTPTQKLHILEEYPCLHASMKVTIKQENFRCMETRYNCRVIVSHFLKKKGVPRSKPEDPLENASKVYLHLIYIPKMLKKFTY